MSTAQLALAFEQRTALGMADFLVAPANRAAVAWLDRWPRWPGPALAIHGPPGSGKTHLAHVFRARSGAVILAAADLAGAPPPRLLGRARCCVVEDADRALALDERAFLHLHNVVAEAGGQLLLTGRRPPARWPLALPDLASRLAAAPAVGLSEPDDALIGAVLVKLFADRQLRVRPETIGYLLLHMERSFAAARRTVAAVDAAALAARRNVTLPLVRQVLRELAPLGLTGR